MGHIQRRSDRPGWRARYIAPDGRERSKTFRRKVDAERFLATVEVDKLRGEWVDPALSRITLATFADRWLSTIAHLPASTRVGYKSKLRVHVLPAFGRLPLRSITPVAVRQWLAATQSTGRSRDTARQAKQVLGAILGLAVEEGYIPKNPTVGIKLGRVAKREQRFLTDRQVAHLANVIEEPYGTWLWFMAYSGLRWGEMAALRRRRRRGNEISVVQSLCEVGGLHFKDTKTYESRKVLLPRFVADMLDEHCAAQVGSEGDALVFTSPEGELLRNSNFQRRIWKPALQEAGIAPGVRIHDLRHTCAALMISEGANPKHIQRHLGHSSISVTMDTYGHLFPEDLEYIAERLDARIRRLDDGPQTARSEEIAAE